MSDKSQVTGNNEADAKYADYGKQWAESTTFWPDAFVDACKDAAAGLYTLDNRAAKPAKGTGKKGATEILDDASRLVDLMVVSFDKNKGENTSPLNPKTIRTKKSELRVAIGLGGLKSIGVNGVNLLVEARQECKNAKTDGKAIWDAFLAVGRLQTDPAHVEYKDKKPVQLKAKLSEEEIKSAVRNKPPGEATLESVWIGIGATLSALITAGKRKDGLVETDKARKALADQVVAVATMFQNAKARREENKLRDAANAKRDASDAAAQAKLDAAAAAAKAAKPTKAAPAKAKVPTKRGK